MPEPNAGCASSSEAAASGSYAERLASSVALLRETDDLELRVDEPMDRHTSLGVGGPADLYAIPRNVTGICRALQAASSCEMPLLVTGRGTNLLVRDGGFRGMVLYIGEPFSVLSRDGDHIIAEAGASLAEVCEFASDAGLSGLEFAAGIPGSVGGAVAMNAGAFGGQMADVIESVAAVGESCEVRHCDREMLEFGYRNSCLRDKHCVAVSVTFKLRPADPQQVRQAALEAVEKRCRRQPLSLGSAGSVFKRPPGDYAGRLLEAAGCKGLRIGGASFSQKHANFIVNEGSATAADIVALIELAKQRVHEVHGVWLEEEICIVGEPPSS